MSNQFFDTEYISWSVWEEPQYLEKLDKDNFHYLNVAPYIRTYITISKLNEKFPGEWSNSMNRIENTMFYHLTIQGITHCSAVSIEVSDSAVVKAEAKALNRALRLFGHGIELWENNTIYALCEWNDEKQVWQPTEQIPFYELEYDENGIVYYPSRVKESGQANHKTEKSVEGQTSKSQSPGKLKLFHTIGNSFCKIMGYDWDDYRKKMVEDKKLNILSSKDLTDEELDYFINILRETIVISYLPIAKLMNEKPIPHLKEIVETMAIDVWQCADESFKMNGISAKDFERFDYKNLLKLLSELKRDQAAIPTQYHEDVTALSVTTDRIFWNGEYAYVYNSFREVKFANEVEFFGDLPEFRQTEDECGGYCIVDLDSEVEIIYELRNDCYWAIRVKGTNNEHNK